MGIVTGILLSIVFIGCIVIAVREAIKAEQKKRVIRERAEKLRRVGENIITTVQEVNGNIIKTRGRHPVTNQFLFFTGLRRPVHKRYAPSDRLDVLVDLNDTSNYLIRWEPAPAPPKQFKKRQRCSRCQGRGSIICTRCRGTGHMRLRSTRNSARILTQACSQCRGRGSSPCARCQGRGFIS